MKERGCLDSTYSKRSRERWTRSRRDSSSALGSYRAATLRNLVDSLGLLLETISILIHPDCVRIQMCEIEGYRIAGRTTSCVHAWLDSCCICVKKLEEYNPYARGISDARVKSSSIHGQTSFRLLRALKVFKAVCELLRATFCYASARTKVCNSLLVF